MYFFMSDKCAAFFNKVWPVSTLPLVSHVLDFLKQSSNGSQSLFPEISGLSQLSNEAVPDKEDSELSKRIHFVNGNHEVQRRV